MYSYEKGGTFIMKLECPDKSFNLWSLFILLYGENNEQRECYKGNINAPFVFNLMPSCDQNKYYKYRVVKAEDFLKKHLVFDLQYINKTKDRSFHNSYIFSNAMKIYRPSNRDSKGSHILFDNFIKKWGGNKIITELYEINTDVLEYWKPARFREIVKIYIRLMLGEDVKLPEYFDNKGNTLKNALEKRTNDIETEIVISSTVRELLRIILLMIDNKNTEDNYEENGKILTWLILAVFLRDEIKNTAFYMKFKIDNPHYLKIINDELSNNHLTSTDAIFVTTQQLKENYGWSELQIAQNVVLNDKILYGVSEESPTEGTPEHWAEHIEYRPSTFGYMYSPNVKKTIIGNYSFCGLRIPNDSIRKKALIDTIEKGLLFESNLDTETVSSLAVPDTHCILYILNLSMNKGEDGEIYSNYEILIDNMLKTILEYAKKRIYFDCVYTRLFIKKHFSIYEELGFQNIPNLEYNDYNSRIYKLNNFPYDLNWKHEIVDNLISLYKKKDYSMNYEFRPCEEKDLPGNDKIYDLIYNTDPYIYPAMFNSKEICRRVLSLVYEKNTDSLFNYSNLYVALDNDNIIGIILWHKGAIKWNDNIIKASFTINGIELPEYFQDVCDNYFSHYNVNQDSDEIEIINVCIDEKYQNMGIGRKLLDSFINWRNETNFQLFCLDKNTPAKQLYTNLNFIETDKCLAYTSTKNDDIWALKYTLIKK